MDVFARADEYISLHSEDGMSLWTSVNTSMSRPDSPWSSTRWTTMPDPSRPSTALEGSAPPRPPLYEVEEEEARPATAYGYGYGPAYQRQPLYEEEEGPRPATVEPH